jgi:hypothetical protein
VQGRAFGHIPLLGVGERDIDRTEFPSARQGHRCRWLQSLASHPQVRHSFGNLARSGGAWPAARDALAACNSAVCR